MTAIDGDNSGDTRAAELADADAEIAELKRVVQSCGERNVRLGGEPSKASLFDGSPAPTLLIDPESGRIAEANSAACVFYGYSREELTALRIWDINSLGETETRRRIAIAEDARQTEVDTKHRLASGHVRDVHVYTGPVDVDGRHLLHAIVFDISARKKAENALRESEERNRAITQSAHDAILTVDSAGTIVGWNPGAEAVFGYAESEVVGRPVTLLMPERFRDEHRAGMKRVGAGGEPRVLGRAVALAGLRKDGSEIPLELTLARWKATDGWFFTGIIRDITERLQTEQALLRSKRHLERVQELAHLGSWEIDLEAKTVTASSEAHRIYALADDDLTLATVQRVVLPEYRRALDAALAACITYGTPYDVEFKIQRGKDGEYRDIHSVAEYDPERRRVTGYVQDITERKRAEEERARLEGQLQQAQKMESVGRLAGGVAHDFNNMLGVILGHADMALQRADPTPPLRMHVAEIRSAAVHSADLTRQLLAFARRQTVAPEVLDLNDAVTGILTMLRRLIGEDVDVVWRPGEELWLLNVDPSQIDQILTNMCVNARHAIAGVGTVTIETGNVTIDDDDFAAHGGAVPGDYVRLSIRDDGCGMDEETRSHLFEPFFTTKAVGQGTGLGLATVYGIVKQNSGFIGVDSEPEHGTTFTVWLPRHRGAPRPAQAHDSAGPERRGHETILLVEDEAAILKLTTMMLERAGYVVLPAGTPGEALRLAEHHAGEIHLLMTDVIMPEMNGLELAERLTSRYPQLERLFMSGYTADIIASHGVLAEGVNFIQKPFSPQDLDAKVRRALDGERAD